MCLNLQSKQIYMQLQEEKHSTSTEPASSFFHILSDSLCLLSYSLWTKALI